MPYEIHQILIEHFRGFQGLRPSTAEYLILGKDANFLPVFTPEHEIWGLLLAYLHGNRQWLSHCGRAENLIHHPSQLRIWPNGNRYHRHFAMLFDCLSEQHDVQIRNNCSFVELLCWPTTGNSTEAIGPLDDLFAGHPTADIPLHLHAAFTRAQLAHLRRLKIWLERPDKVLIIPRQVFSHLCSLPAPYRPTVTNYQHEAGNWFEQGHWHYEPPAPFVPPTIITRYFPYFRPSPPPQLPRDKIINKIANVLANF